MKKHRPLYYWIQFKMLSTDIVTEFRDKASQIHMHPLSFEEFYSYRQGSKTDALYEYMQYGGMPLAVLSDENSKKQYLKGLFETTYFKDIIEHNKLKKTENLDELCTILSDLTGELLNSKKLSNTFKSVKHENIDAQTIENIFNILRMPSFSKKRIAMTFVERKKLVL